MRVRRRRLRGRDLAHERHHGGGNDEAGADRQEGVGEGQCLGLMQGHRPQRLQRHGVAMGRIAAEPGGVRSTRLG